MDPKKSRSLDNKNTRFSRFKWGEDPKLRGVLQGLKDKLFHTPPIKKRVKL